MNGIWYGFSFCLMKFTPLKLQTTLYISVVIYNLHHCHIVFIICCERLIKSNVVTICIAWPYLNPEITIMCMNEAVNVVTSYIVSLIIWNMIQKTRMSHEKFPWVKIKNGFKSFIIIDCMASNYPRLIIVFSTSVLSLNEIII